ncbi:MAG: extracellular solute-binding protein [Hyphomonas sp.]|nr:extracellular solute-binding protein [Hyphomonas sp.]
MSGAASNYSELFKELAESFEAQNPGISITVDNAASDQSDALQRTLRAAVIDDLPDVSFQGPNNLRTIVDRGVVQPLDSLVSSDPDWTAERFSPSVTNSGAMAGQTMALGVGFSFPILYYNADLVRDAQGGTAGLPGDWDGILGVAQAVNEQNPDRMGIYARFQTFYSQSVIRTMGGRLGDESGEVVTLTEPETLAALRVFERIGALGQAQNAMTKSQARQAFSAGQVAIHLDSSSSLRNFLNAAEGNFELGTARLPLAEDGQLATSGFVVVMHTDDPARQDAAWRFMKHVVSPEGQGIIGSRTGFVPSNEIAVQSPDILGAYYDTISQMGALVDSLPYVGPWYLYAGANNARIASIMDDTIEQIIAQNLDARAGAEEAQDQIQALIE